MRTIRTPKHPVPVAERPSENAATYGMVRRDAEVVSTYGAFIDDDTPDGCFGIVVRNVGGIQTYWFRGPFGDPNARIVARTQLINGRHTHYVGGSFFGGTLSPLRREAGAA